MLPAIWPWPRLLGSREKMESPWHFQCITTALNKTRRKRRSSSSFRSWPPQPWFHSALWLLVPEQPPEPGWLGTLGVLPPVGGEGGAGACQSGWSRPDEGLRADHTVGFEFACDLPQMLSLELTEGPLLMYRVWLCCLSAPQMPALPCGGPLPLTEQCPLPPPPRPRPWCLLIRGQPLPAAGNPERRGSQEAGHFPR